ncbi:MAG: addiction module protein [Verrucomicrobiota bacterium]|jgi:hypothetical protein|nr:addiction module protein [Verrucomicrobiota bacterium]
MATLVLRGMSREEKLQAMEAIWEDLSASGADVEAPAWHGEVLRETEARVASGTECMTDWDLAKVVLRGRFA